jgi:tRNA (cytidine/uridine-2'-O-)-methyltransferase
MLHVALWQPEIPPNTGNIARICAATGTTLHIIGQPAFTLDDRQMKRAGLDYWPFVTLVRHKNFSDFETSFPSEKLILVETTRERRYTQAKFEAGCCLLFGNESSGLPSTILERYASQVYGIPMLNEHVRSLNLANSVGIVLFEGLRQMNNW